LPTFADVASKIDAEWFALFGRLSRPGWKAPPDQPCIRV